MKYQLFNLLFALSVLYSCNSGGAEAEVHKLNLSERTVSPGMVKSKNDFNTYLPIYSSIYVLSEQEKRSLTSTVSIHNMNLNDSLFVKQIDYYNTEGAFLRSYIDTAIFLKPMETINIVVRQKDNQGGTGANFLIKWAVNNPAANYPLIEAVMISTASQQGISFTTRGVLLDTPNEKKVEVIDSTRAL